MYNILFEFGIPMKLVRLIKMCLNETCSRIRVSKHFSDMVISRDQNAGRIHNVRTDNSTFERADDFKCLGKI